MGKVVKHGQLGCPHHCGRNCNQCGVIRQLVNPVFTSRKKKGHLKEMQVNRIVKAAAKRVPRLEEAVADTVSPHWLHHAHASHAMDRGAPVHLVKETLGHANIATTGRYLHARPTDSSSLYLDS